MNQQPADTAAPPLSGDERDILLTLFDLGRKVASVIDLDELLPRIPELIGRLIPFDAFALYFFNEKRNEISIGYSVGYPDDLIERRLAPTEGIIGRVVTTQQPFVAGDLAAESHAVDAIPGMQSALAVPLIHKARPIGVLNVLSRERDRYSERDVAILRQFAAHVATALVNARLFERQRLDAEAFETLAEIGREVAALLDLDELLSRMAQLARRLVDYRTFGILLVNDQTNELEIKVAVQYGEKVALPTVRMGEGLVGYAAFHREPVLAPDVSKDPRYIKVVEDVRSELAVPMLLKDRCIGVFDLESPELDAFSKRDIEILTLLASQGAVAIENARLYAEVTANEARLERELRIAQRVQAALLPTQLPRRVKGVDLAVSFAPARELGGDFHDFLVPESSSVIVAVGDVSGKGVAAALYSVFAGELVRGRTFRGRYLPERSSPANVLMSINTILHERQLEEYYCTLCYAIFDLKRRTVTLANSGGPYPVRMRGGVCELIELPGVPLGSFFGVSYDEVSFPLVAGDAFVFATDGVLEAMNSAGVEFGSRRLLEVMQASADGSAADIVAAISRAVEAHRAGFPPNDDTTAVAIKITA
ncbi:MAG TPA: GAF domain-containing protein [Vicinamibacterales bacterium]|jgi:sigma-B regulation protein RsbU (phosphoserine phosphatase)|nr:GAF domain-containing protein [Vicinamibacterales bacterium]